MSTSVQIVIDCADPTGLAVFWGAALGYVLQPPPEGFDSWEGFLTELEVPESDWNSSSALIDPEGEGPRVYFQRVPEQKQVKNRLHLDLNISGGPGTPAQERRSRIDTEVDRLVAAGAEVVGPVEERDQYWVVLQDPEGNEFCVH
jgi:hypothetical protein